MKLDRAGDLKVYDGSTVLVDYTNLSSFPMKGKVRFAVCIASDGSQAMQYDSFAATGV